MTKENHNKFKKIGISAAVLINVVSLFENRFLFIMTHSTYVNYFNIHLLKKHEPCLSFLGDNVDCWMEIQAGKGPWAPPVSGIVPLGSTLTLVVAINDYRGKLR